MYRLCIKRLIDIVISLSLIIILSPLMFIISVCVYLFMGSPIIFGQERIGLNQKPFKFYKFRSMTSETDENGDLLDEPLRMTKFGNFIRSTSLDELPELFLVLTGKMSLIGPRPLPVYYVPYYKEEELKRHSVRGGLIPADTISGKVDISWDEQLSLDVEYANNCSFILDIKIIIATFKVLIDRATTDYGSSDRCHLNEERSGIKDNISR